MQIPDRLRPMDALSVMPLRDVLLPRHQLVPEIRPRALEVVSANCSRILNVFAAHPDTGMAQNQTPRFTLGRDNPETLIPNGGIFFSERYLDVLLGKDGPATFIDAIGQFAALMKRSLESPSSKDARLPTVKCFSAYQELLAMLNPHVAGYEHGVKAIVDFYIPNYIPVESEHRGSILGAMAYDTKNLQTRYPVLLDAWADSEAAQLFSDTVASVAEPARKITFDRGTEIAYLHDNPPPEMPWHTWS